MTLWVSFVVEPAHPVGTTVNVPTWFVCFVRLIYVLLKVNLVDKVFAAGPACIGSIILACQGPFVP